MTPTNWFDLPQQQQLRDEIKATRRHWLVTGAAGFIGSNLVESLLLLDQSVTGFDNFSTGHRHNLDQVERRVGSGWSNFRMVEGDIRDRDACASAVDAVDFILHQAALGSVGVSIEDPATSHDVNVTGFVNMIEAARRNGCRKFVYAASSSTYGDKVSLPQVEEQIGNPLSPYAATKLINEIYADVYARVYGLSSVGLRYFNVFGPRQDPEGAYAAVIPAWIDKMISNETVTINGDGSTSRDFCYVDNAVQAILRAAVTGTEAGSAIYNVAVGEQTSLNRLFGILKDELAGRQIHYAREPVHERFRVGDILHSVASIDKAKRALAYDPTHSLADGLAAAMPWYTQERAIFTPDD